MTQEDKGREVVWGPEIRVDGVRPEWLGDDDLTIKGQDHGGGYSEHYDGWVLDAGDVDWVSVNSIRLPADHPHYAAQNPRTAPSGGEVGAEVLPDGYRPISELLAFIQDLATRDDSIGDDARALLPAEVDPLEQVIADAMCGNDVQPFEVANAIRNSPAARRALASGEG